MKLYLVRHGQTEENEAHIMMGHHHGVLTEKGKQQARETAEMLKNHNFAHIYSSDLDRCVDTAEFIKEFHPDTPLTFTKELRERNLGILQGQPAALVDWDGLPGEGDDKRPQDGESINELKTRALNFISELFKQHRDDELLLVTHNGWIRQTISHFKKITWMELPRVSNAQVVEVEVGEGLVGKVINF